MPQNEITQISVDVGKNLYLHDHKMLLFGCITKINSVTAHKGRIIKTMWIQASTPRISIGNVRHDYKTHEITSNSSGMTVYFLIHTAPSTSIHLIHSSSMEQDLVQDWWFETMQQDLRKTGRKNSLWSTQSWNKGYRVFLLLKNRQFIFHIIKVLRQILNLVLGVKSVPFCKKMFTVCAFSEDEK